MLECAENTREHIDRFFSITVKEVKSARLPCHDIRTRDMDIDQVSGEEIEKRPKRSGEIDAGGRDIDIDQVSGEEIEKRRKRNVEIDAGGNFDI